MTTDDLDAIVKAIVDALKRSLAPRDTRISALEATVEALKAESVKFCGTFQGGKSYRAGDMVRHQSALWICKVATQGTPSKDFVGWELALKKGDAR